MPRPLLMRILPPAWRQHLWSRFYQPTHPRFISLFDAAILHFAPVVAMKLLPGDVISDSIALTGVYDLHFSRRLVKIARNEGGVFVDVGANLGYFSFVWCAQGKNNRAIAFEPSPRNVGLLQHNVQESILRDRIAIHADAVGSRHGVMQFDPGPAEQTGWGGFTRENAVNAIDVSVVTLDEILSDVDEITVLKVDIEGADLWALNGCNRMLHQRRVRHVWWEENKARMRNLGIAVGEAQTFMRSVGYEPVPQGNPEAELVNWYARPCDN